MRRPPRHQPRQSPKEPRPSKQERRSRRTPPLGRHHCLSLHPSNAGREPQRAPRVRPGRRAQHRVASQFGDGCGAPRGGAASVGSGDAPLRPLSGRTAGRSDQGAPSRDTDTPRICPEVKGGWRLQCLGLRQSRKRSRGRARLGATDRDGWSQRRASVEKGSRSRSKSGRAPVVPRRGRARRSLTPQAGVMT